MCLICTPLPGTILEAGVFFAEAHLLSGENREYKHIHLVKYERYFLNLSVDPRLQFRA